jgi:hypothetical protein
MADGFRIFENLMAAYSPASTAAITPSAAPEHPSSKSGFRSEDRRLIRNRSSCPSRSRYECSAHARQRVCAEQRIPHETLTHEDDDRRYSPVHLASRRGLPGSRAEPPI